MKTEGIYIMNKTVFTLLSAAAFSVVPAFAQKTLVPPGALPALNNKPTGAYAASNVETKLNVEIKDGVKQVRFIRDNSDPFVITKAYVLKHADPYTMRGILRHVVAGTTIAGSPVAVDAVRFVGGKGVILISAEEYRFQKNGNNTGFDELVATFDKPKMAYSSGSVEMIYYPKYSSASTLLTILEESKIGFAAPDGVEFARHPDGLQMPGTAGGVVDSDLNALLLTVNRWDLATVKDFLKQVDTPINQVRVTYKVLEVFAENDQKLGLDFQAWKNNDGIDLFSVGGRYNQNWLGGRLTPNMGFTDASFYNFNPKWNTKYLDFLANNGKAKIVGEGTIHVADGKTSTVTFASGAMAVKSENIANKTLLNDQLPSAAANKYYGKDLNDKNLKPANPLIDHATAQGNTQTITAGDQGNRFEFTVKPLGSSGIRSGAAKVEIELVSNSIVGWTGTGTPRINSSSYKTQIQVGNNKKDFVIGGISKTTVTRGVNGIPLLKDLPVLGWLFSTETDTVKKSQYVLIASVEYAAPADQVSKTVKGEAVKLAKETEEMAKCPAKTAGFQQLLIDTNEIK